VWMYKARKKRGCCTRMVRLDVIGWRTGLPGFVWRVESGY
jgi:hypothetical protein